MKLLRFLWLLCPFAAVAQPSSNTSRVAQWLQEGAWDAVLAQAAQAGPYDTSLLQYGGYAAFQNGDRQQALVYYRLVLALDSNHRQALYYAATIYKAEEDYKSARPLLERLCSLAPSVANYQVQLADCYSALSMPRLAIAAFKRAYALGPSSAQIAARLANAYLRQKNRDSADQVLRPALSLHPLDPGLLGAAITLAYYQKDWNRTAALADSMIVSRRMRYEPMLTALYGDLEGVNWKHAVKLGGILLSLGNETEEVLYSTAFAQQHLGNYRTADTLLRKCVRRLLKPSLEQYYRLLAEVAQSQRDINRASACYDTAYYLFGAPFTLYQQGLMLRQEGRRKQGDAAFKKYLALPVQKQDTAIASYMRQVIAR